MLLMRAAIVADRALTHGCRSIARSQLMMTIDEGGCPLLVRCTRPRLSSNWHFEVPEQGPVPPPRSRSFIASKTPEREGAAHCPVNRGARFASIASTASW